MEVGGNGFHRTGEDLRARQRGDGIRIAKGTIYNVAETHTSDNGGHGFHVVDNQPIPEELMKAFLEHLPKASATDTQAVSEAGEKSGLSKWLTDHAPDAASFLLDFAKNAADSDWLSSLYDRFTG